MVLSVTVLHSPQAVAYYLTVCMMEFLSFKVWVDCTSDFRIYVTDCVSDLMKLSFISGKILNDDIPLKEYKIEEKNFVVVMVTKVGLFPNEYLLIEWIYINILFLLLFFLHEYTGNQKSETTPKIRDFFFFLSFKIRRKQNVLEF